jgi:hypothetical protein
MTLSYSVTDDFKVIIKKGTKKIDEVGAFDSAEAKATAKAALLAQLGITAEQAKLLLS